MKKIFTLVTTLFILSSAAFSQTFVSNVSFRTPGFAISYGHRYVETYSFTAYEKNMQLARIKSNYNEQVREIMNLRISASRKVDLIQQLQAEKSMKIQNVNDRFFDYRNKYNYNYYDRHYNCIK